MALRKLYNATPRKILDKNPTLTKFGKIFWAVVDGFNIIPGIFQSKSRGEGVAQENQIKLMRRSIGNTQFFAKL